MYSRARRKCRSRAVVAGAAGVHDCCRWTGRDMAKYGVGEWLAVLLFTAGSVAGPFAGNRWGESNPRGERIRVGWRPQGVAPDLRQRLVGCVWNLVHIQEAAGARSRRRDRVIQLMGNGHPGSLLPATVAGLMSVCRSSSSSRSSGTRVRRPFLRCDSNARTHERIRESVPPDRAILSVPEPAWTGRRGLDSWL